MGHTGDRALNRVWPEKGSQKRATGPEHGQKNGQVFIIHMEEEREFKDEQNYKQRCTSH